MGVDLPQHPLRCHLKDASAAESALVVNAELALETVSQFMGYAVHALILRAQGRYPECSYLFIVVTSVSRSLIVITQHYHHLETVGSRSGSDKTERILKEIVEIL